jgi:hypothetical protein
MRLGEGEGAKGTIELHPDEYVFSVTEPVERCCIVRSGLNEAVQRPLGASAPRVPDTDTHVQRSVRR